MTGQTRTREMKGGGFLAVLMATALMLSFTPVGAFALPHDNVSLLDSEPHITTEDIQSLNGDDP